MFTFFANRYATQARGDPKYKLNTRYDFKNSSRDQFVSENYEGLSEDKKGRAMMAALLPELAKKGLKEFEREQKNLYETEYRQWATGTHLQMGDSRVLGAKITPAEKSKIGSFYDSFTEEQRQRKENSSRVKIAVMDLYQRGPRSKRELDLYYKYLVRPVHEAFKWYCHHNQTPIEEQAALWKNDGWLLDLGDKVTDIGNLAKYEPDLVYNNWYTEKTELPVKYNPADPKTRPLALQPAINPYLRDDDWIDDEVLAKAAKDFGDSSLEDKANQEQSQKNAVNPPAPSSSRDPNSNDKNPPAVPPKTPETGTNSNDGSKEVQDQSNPSQSGSSGEKKRKIVHDVEKTPEVSQGKAYVEDVSDNEYNSVKSEEESESSESNQVPRDAPEPEPSSDQELPKETNEPDAASEPVDTAPVDRDELLRQKAAELQAELEAEKKARLDKEIEEKKLVETLAKERDRKEKESIDREEQKRKRDAIAALEKLLRDKQSVVSNSLIDIERAANASTEDLEKFAQKQNEEIENIILHLRVTSTDWSSERAENEYKRFLKIYDYIDMHEKELKDQGRSAKNIIQETERFKQHLTNLSDEAIEAEHEKLLEWIEQEKKTREELRKKKEAETMDRNARKEAERKEREESQKAEREERQKDREARQRKADAEQEESKKKNEERYEKLKTKYGKRTAGAEVRDATRAVQELSLLEERLRSQLDLENLARQLAEMNPRDYLYEWTQEKYETAAARYDSEVETLRSDFFLGLADRFEYYARFENIEAVGVLYEEATSEARRKYTLIARKLSKEKHGKAYAAIRKYHSPGSN